MRAITPGDEPGTASAEVAQLIEDELPELLQELGIDPAEAREIRVLPEHPSGGP